MKDFIIFTDGDVDVPKPYDTDVVMLPQYYYFDPGTVYGDEQVLTREVFFEQLSSRRAYTAGVNPDLVRNRFEQVLKEGNDILCIAVSSGISGSYNTICLAAKELQALYPESSIRVIDSLSATLGAGFLCADAIELRKQGKSLEEAVFEIERRGDIIDCRVCADGFLYNMVRAMVGTCIYAAEGKLEAADIPAILSSRNRTLAGPTAPPDGLYMTNLWYDEDVL